MNKLISLSEFFTIIIALVLILAYLKLREFYDIISQIPISIWILMVIPATIIIGFIGPARLIWKNDYGTNNKKAKIFRVAINIFLTCIWSLIFLFGAAVINQLFGLFLFHYLFGQWPL